MRNLCKFLLTSSLLLSAIVVPVAANAQGAEYPVATSYNSPIGTQIVSLPAIAPSCISCQPKHALLGIWDWRIVSNQAVQPRVIGPSGDILIPEAKLQIVRSIAGPQYSDIPIF
jgi:hypothetical protein